MKDNELTLTIIRDNAFDNENNYERKLIKLNNDQFNENGIEILQHDSINFEDLTNTSCEEKNDTNLHIPHISPLFYQNNLAISNKTNLNSLNTKKIGQKVQIQLTKGPQGLGFKLAARDNPTGEISPIYVKNILPKGAAIIDGRLQRGDRLLEVNGTDMTVKSLHEAVNILRNTKLGSLVDIIVSRQLNAFPRELVI